MKEPMEDDIEYMEAYLENTLSLEERKAFEERLKTDHTFREEFESFRISYSAIILQSRNELKQRLRQADKNVNKREARIINWKYVSLGIAASICVIFIIIALLQSPSTEELYASYYTPYPNVVAPIERNESVDDPYKRAFQLYEKGQYINALQQFQILLQENSTSPELNLYAGLSALAIDNSETALRYFEKVTEQPLNDYTATALWYSALAHLQKDDKQKSSSTLEQLKQNAFYGKRAQELLDELQ